MRRDVSETVTVRVVSGLPERGRAFDIRRLVFQDEQGVPADEEFDDDDEQATHVLAEASGTAIGTGRVVFHSEYAKIGRMAVRREWRRRGVGRALLEALIQVAAARGAGRLLLHAQVQAIPFYEALGFHVVSDEFEEAGIPHQRMERRLDIISKE
jgi:predicted GNAT family N-acyltransferase